LYSAYKFNFIFLILSVLTFFLLSSLPCHSIGAFEAVRDQGMDSFKKGNYLDSARKLEACLKFHGGKGSNEILYHLAESYRKIGQPENALPHLETLKMQSPDDQNIQYMLQQVNREIESLKLKKVENTLEKGDPVILAAAAESLMSQGKTSEAIAKYKSILAENSKNTKALMALGNIFYQRSDFDEAISFFESTVNLEKDNPYPLIYLGYCHCYKKNFDYRKAAANFNKAVKINPKLYEAHIALGHIYAVTGMNMKAVASFEKAKLLDPTRLDAFYGLSDLHIGAEAYDKAVQELRTALDLDRGKDETYRRLALAMNFHGLTQDAINTARIAIDQKPQNPDNYAVLCEILLDNQHDFSARPFINKGMNLSADNVRILVASGRYWEIQGFPRKAHLDYSVALEKNSTDTMAMYRMANLISMEGNVDKTRKLQFANKYRRVENLQRAYDLYLTITEIDARFPYMNKVKDRLTALRTVMAEIESREEDVREAYLKYDEFLKQGPPGFY
jgi:tetratricopeptide (TPR) repeat protein